jgi:serine/threonine-protein kinase
MLQRAGLAPDAAEPRPERLGRFRLRQRLGGGGMGEVWLAIEEPVGREVALKTIRREHLPFAGARQRFLREVEAVAALQHRGIVPIYSFGEEDGVPYYAMERIAGRSLAEVIGDLRQGPTPQPADLGQPQARSWAAACCSLIAAAARALDHAHGRGVIHRDVKPSNLMLADDGRVLLIDFGLAKVSDQDSMTRSGVQPGSLAYMSPEQVRGEAVDARTDIWSLGVTLYELLTLRSPFAGPTEAETRTAILAAATPPPSLGAQRLPWETAVLTATAMAPERERRYATAAAFAADLEAFAASRPIAARRPGTMLRLRRFVQRRPTLATGLGLGALLVLGLPTSLYLLERSARQRIEREAMTSSRVVSFLTELFREVEPERARGATVPARTILDRGAQRIREELRDEPVVRAALLEAIGTVYLNLGLYDEADAMLHEMRELRGVPATPALRERTLAPLARLADARGDHAAAERLWRDVLAALPPLGAPGGSAAVVPSLRLASAIWRQDRFDEVEQLFAETVATLRQRAPVDDLLLAEAIAAQATFVSERKDAAQAAPLFAEVRELLSRHLPPDHPRRLACLVDAAGNAHALGDYAAAEADLREAVAGCERIYDARHPALAAARETLAEVLLSRGAAAAADQQLLLALQAYRAIYPKPTLQVARALNLQASIAWETGDMTGAAAAAAESLAMFELVFPEGSVDFAVALANQCRLLMSMGRLVEAEVAGERSRAMAAQFGQRSESHQAMALAHLAYVQALGGRTEEARANVDAAVALAGRQHEPRTRAFVRTFAAEVACLRRDGAAAVTLADQALADWAHMGQEAGTGWARYAKGWGLALQRLTPAARSELDAALVLLRASQRDRHPTVANALTALAEVHVAEQDLPAAERALREAVAIRQAMRAPEDTNIAVPMVNLAAVVHFQGRNGEALELAEQCVEVLRGRVSRGHRLASGVVRMFVRILEQEPPTAAVLARLPALRAFAEATLAADDPVLPKARALLPE